MLVLSRKQGESIMVGEDVKITISNISGGRVKVCIEAPRERAIRRTETIPGDATEPTETDPLAKRLTLYTH